MPLTLDWRDILAVISVGLAIDGNRRAYREKGARVDERRAAMRHVAAISLRTLEHDAYEVEALLSGGAWDRASEQVGRLRLALAEAHGAWAEFLTGSDSDKARAAATELTALQSTLQTLVVAPPGEQQTVDMRQQCATVYTLLAELAGKLTYTREQAPSGWTRLAPA